MRPDAAPEVDTMTITIQVDCLIRATVKKGGRSAALTAAEAQLHTEFGAFSRHLQDLGWDAIFRINERPVRREPERRFSPVDIDLPTAADGRQYERRGDKRLKLQDERIQILQLLAKPPHDGVLNIDALRLRLRQVESLLQESPT